MPSPTTSYSTDTNGRRLVTLNSKYTLQTNKTSAPAALDYKTDPAGNQIVAVGAGAVYETVDMLQLQNKL